MMAKVSKDHHTENAPNHRGSRQNAASNGDSNKEQKAYRFENKADVQVSSVFWNLPQCAQCDGSLYYYAGAGEQVCSFYKTESNVRQGGLQ